MTAVRSHRHSLKIRRRGRHATPSQVEKVALQAGKAAPAVAIAGALVAAPQVSNAAAVPANVVTTATQEGHAAVAAVTETRGVAATVDSFATRTVAVTTANAARHAATAQSTYYAVRGGDTLSSIADRMYHNAGDWQYLYHENASTISDPNLIYAGQHLLVPATAPAHYTLSDYVPRHAASAVATVSDAGQDATSHASTTDGTAIVQSALAPRGSYSCSGLEQLWEQAGGSQAEALMAAEIAMAESGGDPNALSPTDDYGLWQINASNGALATLNPFQNAKSAITLSGDGSNWNPWTTFSSGAYSGRC